MFVSKVWTLTGSQLMPLTRTPHDRSAICCCQDKSFCLLVCIHFANFWFLPTSNLFVHTSRSNLNNIILDISGSQNQYAIRRIQIFFNAMRFALFLFSDFGLFVFCFWKLANTPHQSITVVKGWEMNDWIFAWTCHIFSETRLSSARADTIPEMLIINR